MDPQGSRRYGEVSSGNWFRKPGSFFFFSRFSKPGPCFRAVENEGGDKRIVGLELAKLMVLQRQILLSLAIAVIAEVIRIWTSAEQVPFLHKVAPRYLKLVTSSNF